MWTDILSIFCFLIMYMIDQLSWLMTISPIHLWIHKYLSAVTAGLCKYMTLKLKVC